MLWLDRISEDLVDWEKIDGYPDRTIFQSRPWLTFVAKTQKAEPILALLKDDKQTVGFFSGLVVRKFGLRILGSPFPGWTTSYMGLNLSTGISRRAAVEALVRFAFDKLDCVHVEFMDRNLTPQELDGLGLEYRYLSTFEIDLSPNVDSLFAKISPPCRRCIRKAEKGGVLIEEANDLKFADEYSAQLTDVFAKQKLRPTYSVERVRELIRTVHPSGMLLLLRARDSDGRCIATGIFPAMNRTMYFWGGASWRKYQILRPNEAIQWHAMRHWKQRGIKFYDMGGGGEYKRKYGGYGISVPWFRKSKYRLIGLTRDYASELVKIQQRMLGNFKRQQTPIGEDSHESSAA